MLPPGGTLVLRDWQLFMKRLRKKFGANIRFFACGEYGEKLGRPHYHACLFNFDFPDKYIWKVNHNKNILYRSPSLEELWPYGYSSIGDVTFQSAAYVARYVMKKRTGDQAKEHYQHIDDDGVITDRKPEYTVMSRKPGIGLPWLQKFHSDVYPHDRVILNGVKFRPPRFYDTKHEVLFESDYQQLKQRRKKQAAKHADNNTPERLRVRETIQQARAARLKREVE